MIKYDRKEIYKKAYSKEFASQIGIFTPKNVQNIEIIL